MAENKVEIASPDETNIHSERDGEEDEGEQ